MQRVLHSGFLASISHSSSPPFSTHWSTHLELFLMPGKLFPGSPAITVFSIPTKRHALTHMAE